MKPAIFRITVDAPLNARLAAARLHGFSRSLPNAAWIRHSTDGTGL